MLHFTKIRLTGHRSYAHNLSSCKIKAWKKLRPEQNWNSFTSTNWAVNPSVCTSECDKISSLLVFLCCCYLVLISSFLYLYGMQFFPCLHNFHEGIKNICQVYTFINQEGLVMTRFKRARAVWKLKKTENSNCNNNCLSMFISCSTSYLISSWRGHVFVRRWYITRKICSYCSNLFDRNSAWSPSRNSKHSSLCLNKTKQFKKIPPRCEEIHSS